jgi:hypothetical protein
MKKMYLIYLRIELTNENSEGRAADRKLHERNDGEEIMERVLLEHPLVQIYLLFVAALFVAHVCGNWRRAPDIDDDSRPSHQAVVQRPADHVSASNSTIRREHNDVTS